MITTALIRPAFVADTISPTSPTTSATSCPQPPDTSSPMSCSRYDLSKPLAIIYYFTKFRY